MISRTSGKGFWAVGIDVSPIGIQTASKRGMGVLRHRGKIVASAQFFLQVMGLSRPYQWHMSGLKQRILNFCNLLRKAIISKIFPQKMCFEFMQPRLDHKGQGGDADTVCVTNSIDIKFHLRKLGVKLLNESAAPSHPNRIIKKVGELPFIRSIAGFTFLVEIKITPYGREENKNVYSGSKRTKKG